MAIGLIKNNGGIPVTLLTYIYNSISATSELKKGESAVTSAQTITHSGAFTHTSSYIVHNSCGGHKIAYQWAWQVGTDQGYAPDCMADHYGTAGTVTGTLGSTQWCGGWDETISTTVTDCASNTSHGTMAYKLASTDSGIQISLNPTLKSTTISSYLWTFTPTGGSATTIGTSSAVMYKGLGLYSCTVTFYDSNSASSSTHNYTQTFNLTISDYRKKRR